MCACNNRASRKLEERSRDFLFFARELHASGKAIHPACVGFQKGDQKNITAARIVSSKILFTRRLIIRIGEVRVKDSHSRARALRNFNERIIAKLSNAMRDTRESYECG